MGHSGFHVVLVGATSLKGKEVKEVLEQRSFPARRLDLLDEDEQLGKLTEFQGEPTFIRTIDRDSFGGVDFAFFTGSPAFTGSCWKLAGREACRLIDLTETLEGQAPQALVVGPVATAELPPGEGRIFVSAHPAALVISTVLRRLAEHVRLARAIVHVFEPASERGSAGIEELHQQAVSLLSFKQVPQKVFGTQLAFNLLAACGEEIRPTLAEVEQRVERHLERLLGGRVPRPSVRVAQSATFHAHSFSFYLELEEPREPRDIEQALSGEGFDLRRSSEEAPSATGAATSSEILVGDIRRDRANPRGYWLWAAADNLRLAALNAVRIAEELAKVRTP